MGSRAEKAMTEMLITGNWKNNNHGFTFFEIAVVILLIGLMITLASPRIRNAILTDNLKITTRRLVGLVKGLRNDAVREQKEYVVHFELDSNRYWTESSSMSEEERARAREKARQLPDDVKVLDIWFKGRGKKMRGEASIRFTKKGYVRQSVIHLGSEDGRVFTIILNPFMAKVWVLEKYVEFEA